MIADTGVIVYLNTPGTFPWKIDLTLQTTENPVLQSMPAALSILSLRQTSGTEN